MSESNPFDEKMAAIADSMGISLYQRFDLTEASLFLRCSEEEIIILIHERSIEYIQIAQNTVGFFGYQLLEYMLAQVQSSRINRSQVNPQGGTGQDHRIVRFREVQKMVGVSRTTIWRWEMAGKFPMRISLGAGSVGWLKSDIDAWIAARVNS